MKIGKIEGYRFQNGCRLNFVLITPIAIVYHIGFEIIRHVIRVVVLARWYIIKILCPLFILL